MKAFPAVNISIDKDTVIESDQRNGMDLRDYFAAKAMDKVTFGGAPRVKEPEEGWALRDARKAYEIADAMMKARTNERT